MFTSSYFEPLIKNLIPPRDIRDEKQKGKVKWSLASQENI